MVEKSRRNWNVSKRKYGFETIINYTEGRKDVIMAKVDINKKTRLEAASPLAPSVSRQECTNPMLNSAVLQTLFEHASIKEMKTYRLVFRSWWKESLSRWRSSVWVKLADNKCKSNGLHDYLDMINGSPLQFEKHPHRKYKVGEQKLDLAGDQHLEFWEKCGPKITHLQISISHFLSVQRFETILLCFVPNLQFLHLKRNTVVMFGLLGNESDFTAAPPPSKTNELKELQITGFFTSYSRYVPWFRLLEQYLQIESMSIANYDFPYRRYYPFRELVYILNAMVTLAREHGVKWKLQKLDLLMMGNLRRSVFECRHSFLVGQLQLPLATLCLHVHAETKPAALRCMLESCANTLRKLVVYRSESFEGNDEGIMQNFPYGVQLDSLSELWLSGRLLCANLNFLPFTPNLTSLILAQDIGNSLLAAGPRVSGDETWKCISEKLPKWARRGHRRRQFDEEGVDHCFLSVIDDTDFSGLEHQVFPNLKEFIMSGVCERTCYDASKVAALARLMPNLKTLMLGMGNDGVRVACEGWKQLEVLIIQPYRVDQFGLTGIIPRLNHRFPNLTDLTRLRYFGMGFGSRGSRSKRTLTDESVLNAIFPLKNLQGITACYDTNKMSVDVRDELLSKFPHSRIHSRKDDVWEWPFLKLGKLIQ